MVYRLPESKFEQQDRGFVDKVMENLNSGYGGNFVLRHILSELTYNILNMPLKMIKKLMRQLPLNFKGKIN